MNSNDLIINLSSQNDINQSLIGKSISKQVLSFQTRSITNSLKQQQPIIKTYKRRFLMITLSLLLCISNAYQWIQFCM